MAAPDKSALIEQLLVDTGSEFTWIPGDVLSAVGVDVRKRNVEFVMANGEIMTTRASTASFNTASVSLRSAPPADSPLAGDPLAVVSLKAYSSLTSSISDETAVLRCIRSSMSTVTRRIVSCVLRRSARSDSVHSGAHAGIPSPPTVSHQ